MEETTDTADSWFSKSLPFGAFTTFHTVPFQCSISVVDALSPNRPRYPTTQMSFGELPSIPPTNPFCVPTFGLAWIFHA